MFRLLTLVLAVSGLGACSGDAAPPSQAGKEDNVRTAVQSAENPFGMRAEALADGVYAIVSPARGFPDSENRGWNANAAFVVTADGILMFDTGSSERIGQALLAAVRTVSDQPVRWIINTHAHGDHWLGNGAFLGEQPEQILASDIAIELMQAQGAEWVSRFNSMTGGATGEFEPVPARDPITVSGRHRFGGLEVLILRSERAHSPGDLALWLPEQRVLLASDAIYTGRGPATFDSDVQGWIAFLDEMLALEPEVVLPGHGPAGGVEAVQQMRDFFQSLWDQVEDGYEAGKMDYEIAEQAREAMAPFETLYPGMRDSLGEAVSHVYLQVEAALF